MAGDEDAVRTMLERLARAVTAGDGKAAAACWEVPGLVVSAQGTRAIRSLDEVAVFFAGAKEHYNQQGVAGTRPEVQCIEWHSPQLASVTVRWPWLDVAGRDVGRAETSVYLVRAAAGGPKICVGATLGEETA